MHPLSLCVLCSCTARSHRMFASDLMNALRMLSGSTVCLSLRCSNMSAGAAAPCHSLQALLNGITPQEYLQQWCRGHPSFFLCCVFSQGLCIWTHSAGLTYQSGCLHRTRLTLFLVLSLHKPHFLQALPGGIDPKEYLQQWFCDAPFDQIRQENVREMLTYGFFYRRR